MAAKIAILLLLLTGQSICLLGQWKTFKVVDEKRMPVSLMVVIKDIKGNTKDSVQTLPNGTVRSSLCCKPNDMILISSSIYTTTPIFFSNIKGTLCVERKKYQNKEGDLIENLITSHTEPASIPIYVKRIPPKKPRKSTPSPAYLPNRAITSLKRLVINYKVFFDLLQTQANKKSLARFKTLFVDSTINIPNDYFPHGTKFFDTPEQYYLDITSFFLDNLAVTNISIAFSDTTYFANSGNRLYAWVNKKFTYAYNDIPYTISGWIRLTFNRANTNGKFGIIAVENASDPTDSDGDSVPDIYDKCPQTISSTPADINGCNLNYKIRKPKP